MEFLSVQELGKSPKALMFKVDAANFEKMLSLVQQLEFAQALTNMQIESLRNGNSDMTLEYKFCK
jgi:hypothetical protein